MSFWRRKGEKTYIPKIKYLSNSEILIINRSRYYYLLHKYPHSARLISDISICKQIPLSYKELYINDILSILHSRKIQKQVQFIDDRKIERLLIWQKSEYSFRYWLELSLALHKCVRYTSKTLELPYIGNIGD